MPVVHPKGLKPRKAPRQARSEATLDAIFEATIQVLLAEGVGRLTTTRVAERAGVSVGTLYQYFPHKSALLYAVLQRHLDAVVAAVEAASRRHHGRPVAAIAEGLVNAYLDAKTARIDVSQALYQVAAGLDTDNLIADISQRIRAAVATLLASASDARFADLPDVTFALMAAISGATRIAIERGSAGQALAALRPQLVTMCRAYLGAVMMVRGATAPSALR
jgi:AcrR family transcriptional regulator